MVHRSESELTLDNILFEKRNKSYGAYDIRNIYNSHLKTAVMVAAATFSLALLSPQIASWFKAEEVAAEEFIIKEVTLAEPPPIDETLPPPPPPPPVEAPKIASTKFLPPIIKEDNEVVEEQEPPSVEDLKESNPGEVTQEGNTTDLNAVIETNTTPEVVEAPLTFVGQMPAFKDGDYRVFIQKNMKYPSEASEKNIQGKVYLKFVVEKDGSISDVKVLKGPGNGLNEEAIRLVKLMDKKWSPGLNNGNPTRVYKSLDIEFKLVIKD